MTLPDVHDFGWKVSEGRLQYDWESALQYKRELGFSSEAVHVPALRHAAVEGAVALKKVVWVELAVTAETAIIQHLHAPKVTQNSIL